MVARVVARTKERIRIMANVRVIDGMLSGGGQAYLHTAGPGDVSPGFMGYEPDCGWCWLGAPHTVDAHDSRVGKE